MHVVVLEKTPTTKHHGPYRCPFRRGTAWLDQDSIHRFWSITREAYYREINLWSQPALGVSAALEF